MKKKTKPINTIFAFSGTVVLIISLLIPGVHPSELWFDLYISAIIAAALATLFSALKKSVLYSIFMSVSLIAALVSLFNAPSTFLLNYNIEIWHGYLIYLLIPFFIQALSLIAAVADKQSFATFIVSIVPIAGIICITYLFAHELGWTKWQDSLAYSTPCIIGVLIAFFLTSLSSIILALPDKTGYVSMSYDAYVKKLMRKYSSSEFAKQTGLKKKEVADKKGCSLQTIGNFGEYAAYSMLKRGLPGKKKFLFGVIIPEEDGGFQEIDLLCFWRNMIIVGEAKNYSGHLTRDGFAPKWKLRQRNVIREVGNPYLQNWQHRLALSWFLSDKNNIIPVERMHDTLLNLTFLNRKCSYDTSHSKHSIRYGCVPTYVVTEEGVADLYKDFSVYTFGKELSFDVENAYNFLSSLQHKSKESLAAMAKRREYSSVYRTATYRMENYYVDDQHRAIYRQNGLYTERLNIGSGNEIWKYVGTADPAYTDGMRLIDDPEWEYGRLLLRR